MVPNMCWEFMKEFIQGFLESNTLNVPPQYLQVCRNTICLLFFYFSAVLSVDYFGDAKLDITFDACEFFYSIVNVG